jgi:HK97 family phage major capsid protein
MSKTLPKDISSCITSKFPAARAHPMLFAALAGLMVATVPPPTPVDETDQLQALKDQMVDLHNKQSAITAKAAAEGGRLLTAEEQKEMDLFGDQFDTLSAEVERRERLIAQRQKLETPGERKVKPADPTAAERPRITGGERVGATRNSWGWESVGAFAKGLRAAAMGSVDNRLTAAATTYGSEGANADGGFAVPPDFREGIVKKIEGEASLLSRCDQQTSSSSKLTVPRDNTTPHQSTGGIQANWEGEAAAAPPSKPALAQMECKLSKLMALVPMTDELLEDVPSLTRYLPGKVADKFTFKINDAIINGDGVGKPLGLLNSPAKVTVDQEEDQEADTIVMPNITKMWSRLHPSCRDSAIFLINQDLEPQLVGMTVGDKFPAYLPPGGLSAKPYGTLMGAPVLAVESCKELGTEGDIILTDLSKYLAAMKTGGMKQDVSIHAYFDQAVVAFRFIIRLGGQPWWEAPMERANGANTLSSIVTLEDRTGA